jgi:hypothetical protein
LNEFFQNKIKDTFAHNYANINQNLNNLEHSIKNLKQNDKLDSDQLGILKQIITETEKNIIFHKKLLFFK